MFCLYTHNIKQFVLNHFILYVILENLWSNYIGYQEAAPGVKGVEQRDVVQDISTNFFILLAIYFPSVTGIMTGSNMSGMFKDIKKGVGRWERTQWIANCM